METEKTRPTPKRGHKLVAGAAIAGGVAALVPLGRWAHERAVRNAQTRLLEPLVAQGGLVYPGALVPGDLPAPVVRYLRRALYDGAPRPALARVRQRGLFRGKVDGPWWPFTAVQDFSLTPPGFVWSAPMRVAPGLRVYVLDSLLAGRGHFGARLGGLVPMAHGDGPEVDASALLRYLAEAVWCPHAFLPGGAIRWAAIDDRTARAWLRLGALEVAGNFHFDEHGRPISFFTDERYHDLHGVRTRGDWVADFSGHERFDGVEIPTQGTARWLLPEGPFEYVRLEVTSARYGTDTALLADARA